VTPSDVAPLNERHSVKDTELAAVADEAATVAADDVRRQPRKKTAIDTVVQPETATSTSTDGQAKFAARRKTKTRNASRCRTRKGR
jgi:glucan-binding YG repeat protein